MLDAVVVAQEFVGSAGDGDPIDFAHDRRFGVAAAGLGFRYGRSLDHEAGTRPWSGYDAQFGAFARALYGKRVGWAFGLGFSAGGIIPQGVDFRFDLLPAGFGVALPRMGFVTLMGGIRPAFSSYDPYALLLFPVELRAEIDVCKCARLIVAAELDFSTVGRGTVPGTDGFSALVALRYRARKPGPGERDGSTARGRFVGIQLWEVRGVPYLGFVLGVEAGFGG